MKICILLAVLLCGVRANPVLPEKEMMDADDYNSLYQSLGCWKDEGHRAIPGNAVRYDNDVISRCADRARRLGNTIFAIQDNNGCFTAGQFDAKYNVYGKSDSCQNGKGGSWLNSVYELRPNNRNTKWQSLGCYRDNNNRAFKGGFKTFPKATVIDDCHSLAVSRHHQYFGIESGDQCFTGNNIENVQRYGLDRDCNDGRGGSWKLSVYRDAQSVQSVSTITLTYRDDKGIWEEEKQNLLSTL